MTVDVDRLCDNRTLMDARVLLSRDRHGHNVAVAIAKMSWSLLPSGQALPAVPPRPIRTALVRRGTGFWSSVRYPSDLAPDKPGTDVIVLGSAVPPEGRTVTELDVSVRVETGERRIFKAVRVFGPRVFMGAGLGLAPGPALPLRPTPIVYELARGGVDEQHLDDERAVDWRNPSGRGHRLDTARLVDQPAFVIEPLGGSEPAGFGPIDTSWQPRLSLYGTCDAAWARRRAPIAPRDFDPRFECWSHPDLWSETPLAGTEPVEILGATPSGALRFKLPELAPRFVLEREDGEQALATHLDTFLVDLETPHEPVVELVWRASVQLPRKPQILKRIVITAHPPLSDDLARETLERLEAHAAHSHA
jgi:hypothetical protein